MKNKINYKGEDIHSASVYYYSVTSNIQNTFNIVVDLDEDIDCKILRKALDLCQIRYPYLMIKVVKSLKKISLKFNSLPIVLKHSKDNFVLGTSDTNYHCLALKYYKQTLVLSIFHGLVDGNGVLRFLKTLLYYYVSDKYNENPSSDNIRLITDTIDLEEYTDPFISYVPKNIVKSHKTKKKKTTTFRIVEKDNRVKLSDPYYFYLKIPEKDLIHYCKANGASPATLFNLLVAKSIKKLNPNITDSIDGGVINDLRSALGALESHFSTVGSINLSFDAEIQKLANKSQYRTYRKRIKLFNNDDNINEYLTSSKKFYEIINKIPVSFVKKAIIKKIIKLNFSSRTFMISYVGKINFGDIEKHIQSIYSDPDCPGSNIMLEANAINNYFFLSYVQEWKERLYFDAFCEEIKNIGLSYEIVKEGDYVIPRVIF